MTKTSEPTPQSLRELAAKVHEGCCDDPACTCMKPGCAMIDAAAALRAFATRLESDAGDARDGERWRALLNCSRLRILGWAGFGKEGNYRHFGAEFWTMHPAPDVDCLPRGQSVALLTEFADAALRASDGGEKG